MEVKQLTQRQRAYGSDRFLYYQDKIVVGAGEGNTSSAYFVLAQKHLKVYTKNAYLYESLDTTEDIENDIAEWTLIAPPTADEFVLTAGVSHLYITNSSDTEEAILRITGV